MFLSAQRKSPTKTCVLCNSYFKQYHARYKCARPESVKACTCCRVAKAKCEASSSSSGGCSRCEKLGLHCVSPSPKRSVACALCQKRKERCKHIVRRERSLRFSWSMVCLSLPLDCPALGLLDYEPLEFASLLRESERRHHKRLE